MSTEILLLGDSILANKELVNCLVKNSRDSSTLTQQIIYHNKKLNLFTFIIAIVALIQLVFSLLQNFNRSNFEDKQQDSHKTEIILHFNTNEMEYNLGKINNYNVQ